MIINKKPIILLFIGLFSASLLPAQVGINIKNPQGWFHVDPLGNTSGTSNGEDDVIISENGNVGIGTLAPSAKLHIQSPTPGAIRIDDGTQGENKVLTSDANGVGKWMLSKGSFIQGTVFAPESTQLASYEMRPTRSYIVIPPNTSCVISCMAQFYIRYSSQPALVMGFSTSNTTFQNASPSNQFIFNRLFSASSTYLMCSGYVTDIRNNSNTEDLTLYLWARTDYSGNVYYSPANTVNDIRLYAIVY